MIELLPFEALYPPAPRSVIAKLGPKVVTMILCCSSATSAKRPQSYQCYVSVIKLMSLSIALSYISSCHAFHSTLSRTLIPRISMEAPLRMTSHPRAVELDADMMSHGSFIRDRNLGSCSKSRLFSQRQVPTKSMRRLLPVMKIANDPTPESSNKVLDKSHRPLHIRVWNSIREILARLWVSRKLSLHINHFS